MPDNRVEVAESSLQSVIEERNRLREVALAYEAWEGELVMCDKAWTGGLPRMTQDLYDRFIEIQGQRNDALGRNGR